MVRDGSAFGGPRAGADRHCESGRTCRGKSCAKGLSVRETERLVKATPWCEATGRKDCRGRAPEKDADTRALEADLSANLRMHRSASTTGPPAVRGEVTIRYAYDSLDDLDRLCQVLSHSYQMKSDRSED